jgi:hypothetical protein
MLIIQNLLSNMKNIFIYIIFIININALKAQDAPLFSLLWGKEFKFFEKDSKLEIIGVNSKDEIFAIDVYANGFKEKISIIKFDKSGSLISQGFLDLAQFKKKERTFIDCYYGGDKFFCVSRSEFDKKSKTVDLFIDEVNIMSLAIDSEIARIKDIPAFTSLGRTYVSVYIHQSQNKEKLLIQTANKTDLTGIFTLDLKTKVLNICPIRNLEKEGLISNVHRTFTDLITDEGVAYSCINVIKKDMKDNGRNMLYKSDVKIKKYDSNNGAVNDVPINLGNKIISQCEVFLDSAKNLIVTGLCFSEDEDRFYLFYLKYNALSYAVEAKKITKLSEKFDYIHGVMANSVDAFNQASTERSISNTENVYREKYFFMQKNGFGYFIFEKWQSVLLGSINKRLPESGALLNNYLDSYIISIDNSGNKISEKHVYKLHNVENVTLRKSNAFNYSQINGSIFSQMTTSCDSTLILIYNDNKDNLDRYGEKEIKEYDNIEKGITNFAVISYSGKVKKYKITEPSDKFYFATKGIYKVSEKKYIVQANNDKLGKIGVLVFD